MEYSSRPVSKRQLEDRLKEIGGYKDSDAQAFSLYRQSFGVMVLAQFLPEHTCIKGGMAISLRYPLSESRQSQDVDTLYAQSRESFIHNLEHNLAAGWNDFTETMRVDERKHTPEGIQLTALRIKLFYHDKPFISLKLEATPDIGGHIAQSDCGVDSQTLAMCNAVGIQFSIPHLMDSHQQLAEKLDGVSNREYARGRDIYDIAKLIRHTNALDLQELRTTVRKNEQLEGAHHVHLLDTERYQEFQEAYYNAVGNLDYFDDDWELVSRLTFEVDPIYTDQWHDQWSILERNASLTSSFVPSSQSSELEVQVSGYMRNGTWVAPYTRKKRRS